jgi:hypothetical protein
MHKLTASALFLTAACFVPTGASSQTIYKCGASYSQTPCSGGNAIDVTDTRTSEQKKQTDVAANRDAQIAERMEKSRILQEKTDLASNTPPATPTKNNKNSRAPSASGKKKPRTPDHFIAQAPGEEKKKAAVK